MKANTKYTALEILTEAGIEKPEEKFGKFRIIIGGILGIVKPDHVIRIQSGVKEIDVVVGIETVTIHVDADSKEATVSEGARIAIDAKGALSAEDKK